MVENEDGDQEIVVAGGQAPLMSTEIFSLKDRYWRPGPDIPGGNFAGASVQTGKDFVVLGGYTSTGVSNRIYRFDRSAYNWIQQAQVRTMPLKIIIMNNNNYIVL